MSANSISGANTPKYLYAGPVPTELAAVGSTPSARPSPGGGDVVSISGEAKAAFAASSDKTSAGGSVRARLDAQYKAATAAGSSISFDSAKGGKWLDLSSFTDDELSEIALNRDGKFSQDEADLAGGGLSGRVEFSLRPYAQAASLGDRRAQATAINALYDHMSDNVRAALKWTPAMMVSNNSMLQGDSQKFGWLDGGAITAWLGGAFDQGGLQFTT